MHASLEYTLSDSVSELQASRERRQSATGSSIRSGVTRGSFDEHKRGGYEDRANEYSRRLSSRDNGSFEMGSTLSSIRDRRRFLNNRTDSFYSISSIGTPTGSIQQLNKTESLEWGNANGEDTTCLARKRKRLANFLHSHVALIIICALNILDAACVVVQVIGDLLIVKVELHELEMRSREEADLLTELIPSWFNSTIHGEMTFAKTLVILRSIKRSILDEFSRDLRAVNKIDDHNHRVRRDVKFFGGEYGDNDEGHEMLHDIAHYFHFASVVILSVLMFETLLKVFAMGKAIFHHKIEVFDAFVVTTSWILDIIFLKGIWLNGTEGATILVFLLPWRVIRVVNSFVVVTQEKGQVALKIAKSQYKSTLRRLEESRNKNDLAKIEIANFRSLCKKKGLTEDDIKNCKPKGRRKPSLFRRLSSSTIQKETSLDLNGTAVNGATSKDSGHLRNNSIDASYLHKQYIPAFATEIRRASSLTGINL